VGLAYRGVKVGEAKRPGPPRPLEPQPAPRSAAPPRGSMNDNGAGPGPTRPRMPGPWAAPPPSAGRRELFPVPPVATLRIDGRRRRQARRHADRAHEDEDVNRAISSLNWMAGFRGPALPVPSSLAQIHHEVHQRVRRLVRDARQGRAAAPSVREALGRLRGGRTGYDLDAANVALAPFDIGRVALPDDVSHSPYIGELVPDAVRSLVEVEDQPFFCVAIRNGKLPCSQRRRVPILIRSWCGTGGCMASLCGSLTKKGCCDLRYGL